MKVLFESLESSSAKLEKALEIADENDKKLQTSHELVKQSLENTATLLCDMVQAKKKQILLNLDHMVTEHRHRICEYKDSLQKCRDEQLGFCREIKSEIQDLDPAIAVCRRKFNTEKANRLVHDVVDSNQSLGACARSNIILDKVEFNIENSMKVYLTDVKPSQCRVELRTWNARVGINSELTLWTSAEESVPASMPSLNIVCQMNREANRRALPTKINLHQLIANEYSATLKFEAKGRHKLLLEVEGEHVPGSPFHFHVKPSNSEYQLSDCIGRIRMENSTGMYYAMYNGQIVYSQVESVQVVNQKGAVVKTIKDWSFSAFSEGYVLFGVDKDTKSIFEIDLSEEKKTECLFSRIYGTDKELISDIGVLHDMIYVLYNIECSRSWLPGSSKQFCVRVFLPDSHNCTTHQCKLHQFGEVGTSREQLNGPSGIFCIKDRVYVADTGNHRVQVYDKDGKWLHRIGYRGEECGYLYKPFAVALYENFVLISDQNRVSLFWSNALSFIMQLSYYGNPLSGARITVDRSGVFYIENKEQSCLLLY